MTVLDFIVLALAASAVVDVWFNGSLFADWRAYFQSRDDNATLENDADEDVDPIGWVLVRNTLGFAEFAKFHDLGTSWSTNVDEACIFATKESAEQLAYSESVDTIMPLLPGRTVDLTSPLVLGPPESPRAIWMRLFDRLPDWLVALITCKFCFSHHTPWVLALLCYLPAWCVAESYAWLWKLPVYSLAATRLGNILNAYARDARYERDAEPTTTIYEEPSADGTE